MDCQQVEHQNIIERYLAGRLSDQESEAFEEHYVGCQGCFDELQLCHAAAIELNRQPAVPLKTAPFRWNFGWGWGLAAAAVLLFGVVSILLVQLRQTPATRQNIPVQVDAGEEIIAKLAAVDSAPLYVPWTIRGGRTGVALEKFQQGMQRYNENDFSSAIVLLREAARLNPTHEPTLFYLGISYLLTNQPDRAITELSKLTRLQSTPYLEESHWYLAKACFRKKDVAKGRAELEAVASLNGPHAEEAREALKWVSKIGASGTKATPAQ